MQYRTSLERLENAKRIAKKLGSTLRVCATMFAARMFGTYVVSGFGDFEYVKYKWHGDEWIIPISPVKHEDRE